mgnify:CR=1 FL=1
MIYGATKIFLLLLVLRVDGGKNADLIVCLFFGDKHIVADGKMPNGYVERKSAKFRNCINRELSRDTFSGDYPD